MRPTFKKLEVKDIGDLEKLVAENVEGIESGLKVIDSRLLLGNAAIDLVGLDAKGSLVLIALDFTADEGLLLRVMDACSWCLEYPDTFRRLYPMAQISPGRPPRILFIVERLTDSFMRRIKQLSFLEIDCLEFRHLEVNGASALYFDLVQRLRRSEAAEAAADSEGQAPRAVPVVEPPRPVEEAAHPVIEPTRPVVEPVRPVLTEPPAPEPPVPEPAPTLDARIAEIFAEPGLSAVEEPLVEEPRMEEAERPALEIESLHAPAHQQEPVAPMAGASRNSEWQTLLSQLGVEMPLRPRPAAPEPAAPTAEPGVAAAEGPIEVPTPPAWAKSPAEKAVQPGAGRTYFFAQAGKGTGPTEPQAAQPAQAAAAAPAWAKPAAPAAPAPAKAAEVPAPDRPELDSLNVTKDGLSRQWLEFLNQLGAAK